MKIETSDADRNKFLSMVNKSDTGCWNWSGVCTKDGYGWFTPLTRLKIYAHRFSYLMFIGEIGSGMCVLHKCDNPRCVNPEHLFLGTQSDNMTDKKIKGRAQSGDMHWTRRTPERRSKTTFALVGQSTANEIRWEYASGQFTYKELAEKHGVHFMTVCNIVRNVTNKRNGVTDIPKMVSVLEKKKASFQKKLASADVDLTYWSEQYEVNPDPSNLAYRNDASELVAEIWSDIHSLEAKIASLTNSSPATAAQSAPPVSAPVPEDPAAQ